MYSELSYTKNPQRNQTILRASRILSQIYKGLCKNHFPNDQILKER